MSLDSRTKSASLKLLAALLTAGLVAACASVDQAIEQVKQGTTSVFSGTQPASASPATQPAVQGIRGTELEAIYKKFPITNSRQPEQFPRAAITITSASPAIFRGGQPVDDECVTFNVRLWTSMTQSKAFNNLRMCAAQRSKDVPFVSLKIWPDQFAPTQNTGAVRTDGPQRPATNFPPDVALVNAWFDKPSRGIFFIGSILYQMGYEWTQPGELRAWFVSAPRS